MHTVFGTLFTMFLTASLLSTPVQAQERFTFGVISNAFQASGDESLLLKSLVSTDNTALSFLILNGIKSGNEPCTDDLYAQRHDLLRLANTSLIISLTANDWAQCHNKSGANIAVERLNHIRELFFADDLSFGAQPLSLIRQSITPKFRSYAENARWEFNGILFATMNIPSSNNHYVQDGGRNSEFEDRLIANRDWLRRLFLLASVNKSAGIVVFVDADVLTPPTFYSAFLQERRDGYSEIRQLITKLALSFKGQVLIVHNEKHAQSSAHITWQKNLGQVTTNATWMKIAVQPRSASVFTVQSSHVIARLPAPSPAFHEAPLTNP